MFVLEINIGLPKGMKSLTGRLVSNIWKNFHKLKFRHFYKKVARSSIDWLIHHAKCVPVLWNFNSNSIQYLGGGEEGGGLFRFIFEGGVPYLFHKILDWNIFTLIKKLPEEIETCNLAMVHGSPPPLKNVLCIRRPSKEIEIKHLGNGLWESIPLRNLLCVKRLSKEIKFEHLGNGPWEPIPLRNLLCIKRLSIEIKIKHLGHGPWESIPLRNVLCIKRLSKKIEIKHLGHGPWKSTPLGLVLKISGSHVQSQAVATSKWTMVFN